MRRTELLQEDRKMPFEEAYGGWQERREPPRASRRLHSLSLREEMADDFTDKILSGSPGARAVLLVLERQGEHDSQWSAITSVASKLGCTAQTLHNWVR